MQNFKLWLARRRAVRVPRRIRSRRPRAATPRTRRRKLLLFFCLTLSVIIFFWIWTDTRLRPAALTLAEARVRNIATEAINDAILSVIERESVDYATLVIFDRDSNGEIQALQTNMVSINRLKTEVSNEVLLHITNINRSELQIPMGNLTENPLLFGRGPNVNVRIVPVGSVTADFENVFSTAGINQTRHQIFANITIRMNILTMSRSEEIIVTANMVIAETVIVGNVPGLWLPGMGN